MTGPKTRAKIAATAVAYYQKHGRPGSWLRYGMHRPMPSGLYTPEALRGGRIDCSSFATLVFREAGALDPNGRGFDGQGYTGTLWNYGSPATGAPQPGDLAFYGDVYATNGHVAVVINQREVISFGHTPIEREVIRYRSDFVGLRRYAITDPAPPERWYVERLPHHHAGATGPRVMGPWYDPSRRFNGPRRLAKQMQSNGRRVALRTRGDRAWILEYAEGTYGDRVRWGWWSDKENAEAARAILEKREGPLRLYEGSQRTHYPMIG